MLFTYFLILLQTQLISGTSVLKVRETQEYEFLFSTKGSKSSKTDSAFWRPKLWSSDEYFISFVNRVGTPYYEPKEIISIVITDAPPDALASPIAYQQIFRDTHYDDTITFFKPIPPNNYICFGDMVVYGIIQINSFTGLVFNWGWKGYKCIHKNYINEFTDLGNSIVKKTMWVDTHADNDVSVLEISLPQYPYKYYKIISTEYTQDIGNGPYYSFNIYASNCKVIKVEANNEDLYVEAGIVDSMQIYSYVNNGNDLQKISTQQTEKRETEIQSFTHTQGTKLGTTVTAGISTKIDSGIGIESTISYELSVSAEFSEEWEETSITEKEIIVIDPAQEFDCPGRTKCKREFIVFKSPNKEIPTKISVQCGNDPTDLELIEGILKASGVVSIEIVDDFTPLDCNYYTDDYFDRGNGKLWACDNCNVPNMCKTCRDYSVLINDECYDDDVCTEECDGIIKSPIQTVPFGSEPDFAGRYCSGAKINCPAHA